MSTRSVQAGKLGYEMAQELGLRRVEVRWSGTKKNGSFGGWRVEWTDGPTVPRMRVLVSQRARRFPAVPVPDLGYDRCHTPLAEAIALLLYVDRQREWVDCIETPLIFSGFDAIDWPERADRIWHDRARALLRYSPDPGETIITAYAVHALAKYARIGWDNALAWLDRLAAEQVALAKASNVISIVNRRAARIESRAWLI